MTKRELLHQWLLQRADWVYLREVPYEILGMSRAGCSTALHDLCQTARADFRIVCNKQYIGKPGPAPIRGRGTKKLNEWKGKS